MQYILSEEEYKKLMHKERITMPLKEFKDSFNKLIQEGIRVGAISRSEFETYGRNNYFVEFCQQVNDIVRTLEIKLDL